MSVYKFVELVGTSTESWEKAASSAIEIAAKEIPDPRVAEVTEMDLQILGETITYRIKMKVSFKVEETPKRPSKKRSVQIQFVPFGHPVEEKPKRPSKKRS